ncbi:TetR/AcrR family transcriptional regulator [Nonomuraea sp. NN258]|uniref:TetR/AcrR family transcriptional regulator n=1 Tax=Nonomuraea antri TaxID=2730852 RepID=UPI0015695F77|nr:TetR/AcrR family transcriptional regulator [Nonomuraea antri]NRQ37379.1 TetR/AcrR family transcriptional regulator [Nonomuraea antri]
MPIEVDEVQRLNEIAAATIEVARQRGVRAVTIRAVAQQLGGSTAMVTNYVSSRAALMYNALRRAEEEWEHDKRDFLDGAEGEERLRSLVRWMCTTDDDDDILRRLLIEIASSEKGAAAEGIQRASRGHREEIAAAVAEAGTPAPALTADILYLLLRGYWLATLEDAEGWPSERGAAAALAVLDLLERDQGLAR